MKKIVLYIFLLTSILSFAQNGINYKALIKDDLGNVVANEIINVRFTIIDDAGPTDVYQETHVNATTDANGIVILAIGTGAPDLNLFADVDWSTSNSLKVEIDIEQDTTFEFMNTTQFLVVPYAMQAKSMDKEVLKIDDLNDGKTDAGNASSIFLGEQAGLDDDGTNNNNVGVGYRSLYNNIDGYNNTAVGNSSLISNTTGYENTAIGVDAGLTNITGHSNVFIGPNTGHPTNANENHKLYIDNTETATPLIYGEFDNDLLRINGTLDINNAYQLPVADGSANQILQTDGAGIASWQTPEVPSGLEYITEEDSNGFNHSGWRFISQTPNSQFYGPIGTRSVDLSYSNSTSETRGATGDYAIAMGDKTTASGDRATAMGDRTTASGDKATAMGIETNATGNNSTAIGIDTTASGDNSIAMGNDTSAIGTDSFSAGKDTSATANNSTAIGNNTTALGINSTSMGIHTIATAYASTAIGKFSEADVNGLFIVGNGTSTSSRNNAFIIKEDGKVGIGRNTPSSLFEVYHQNGAPTSGNRTNAFSVRNVLGPSWQFYTQSNGNLHLYNNGTYRGAFLASSGAYTAVSDRKLKKDILVLENGTLNKVMQLNPVSYLMKDQTDTKRNHGLISQEVKEIFPSITHYVKESDLLTLSYTELIPILIKAMQEQQAIIEAQKEDLKASNKKYEGLLSRIEEIEAKISN